jgi:hypothetical protein
LKKWLKFEDYLNKKLVALLEQLLFLYQKLCPIRIQQFFSRSSLYIKASRIRIIKSLKSNIIKTVYLVPAYAKRFGDALGNFQGYLTHLVLSLKAIKKNKSQFKVIYHGLLASLVSILHKIKSWYLGFKKSTVIVSVMTTAVISYSIYNIYMEGNSILSKLGRKPASVDSSLFVDVRSKYYKRNERFFILGHVKLPLFIESVNSNKNILINFTVQPSNKYIKEYFLKNQYIIKDKLSVTVHPVIPSLPITEEGKLIIKEKIKAEFNNLLKEKNIEGEIEDIYVNSILGT